jgi:hypothetical protein
MVVVTAWQVQAISRAELSVRRLGKGEGRIGVRGQIELRITLPVLLLTMPVSKWRPAPRLGW